MEEEEEEEELMLECKRSDDPTCDFHALHDVSDEETVADDTHVHNVHVKRFSIESFLSTASGENGETGVVDEQEHVTNDKEVIDEDEVTCTIKGDIKTCNIDSNMDALFHNDDEDNNECNDVDFCVSNDGFDGYSNKSADSLSYHSTDSIQYHSADYSPPAVNVAENGDLFNISVAISLNHNTAPGFDNDVPSSSEIVNSNNEQGGRVICKDETLDSTVTVTTVCESLSQENDSSNSPELSIGNSDSVVMNTFNISSADYDASVTTTLEVSSSDIDDSSSEPCGTPSDENSVIKTFEITSPSYDATITARVTDVTSPGATDIADSNNIEISSPDLDSGIKTYTEDHDGKTEIDFKVSCPGNEAAKMLSTVSSQDGYIDTVSDITSVSILSHESVVGSSNYSDCSFERDLVVASVETYDDTVISPRTDSSIEDLHDSDFVNDSTEMMFLISADSIENNSDVDMNMEDVHIISDEHSHTHMLSESATTTYYEDVNNVVGEVSHCDEDITMDEDGLPETSLATCVSDTLPTSLDTDSVHGDGLYASNASCADTCDVDVVAEISVPSDGVDVHKTDISTHNILNVLSETTGEDIVVDTEVVDIPVSDETMSVQEDVLYDSNVTFENSDVNIVGCDDLMVEDVEEADVIHHTTTTVSCVCDAEGVSSETSTYYDADVDESNNITHVEIPYQEGCTNENENVSCHEVSCDSNDEECDISLHSSDISYTEHHEHKVGLTPPSHIVSSIVSEFNDEIASSSDSNVIVEHECQVSIEADVASEPSSLVSGSCSKPHDISDSDSASLLNNSNDNNVDEIEHQHLPDDAHTHVDTVADNPVNDNTVKVVDLDYPSTLDEHTFSPGDLEKISSYSSLEAGFIIDQTLDVLHSNTAMGSVESDVTFDQSEHPSEDHITTEENNTNSHLDNDIRNLTGFSQHEAEVVLVKTFEELSSEFCPKPGDASNSRVLTDELSESSRRLSAFSDLEADAIINRTFEDLSREAVNISPEFSASSVEQDVPEKAYDILSIDTNIPDKVITHAISEDNFAHLSLSLDGDLNTSASSEAISQISSFSEHEADVIIHRTFEHLYNDVSQSTPDVPFDIPSGSETASEITYHVVSLEDGPSNVEDTITVVEMVEEQEEPHIPRNESSGYLVHGYNSTACKNNEVLVKEFYLPTKETDNILPDTVEIIDKGLEDLSSEQSITKSSENTYDVYSFDDRDSDTTVKIADSALHETFEDLSQETNRLNETRNNEEVASCECEHETGNTVQLEQTFDVIGEQPISLDVTTKTNLSEKTYDILSLGNDLDEKGDVEVSEKGITNETFEHISDNNIVDVNLQMSACADEFLDIVDDEEDDVETKEECTNIIVPTDVSAYVHLSAENTNIDTDIDVVLPEKNPNEITDHCNETKSIDNTVIDSNVHQNLSNEYHRNSSQFENIESETLVTSSNITVDISVEQNKTSHVIVDTISDNVVSVDDIYSKEEQSSILTIKKPSRSSKESSAVFVIHHTTNEVNGHTPHVTISREREASPTPSHKKHAVKVNNVFSELFDDYVIIDQDEVSSIPAASIQPRFSITALTYKFKRAFSIGGESNIKETKCDTNENNKLRVQLKESSRSSTNGEEIQVLTFHRTAIKSDDPANVTFKHDGDEGDDITDHQDTVEGGTYNEAVIDSHGNLVEREPGVGGGSTTADASTIDMKAQNEVMSSAFGGKKGSTRMKKPNITMLPFGAITANLVNMAPVVAAPDLKLTGKFLTLEKNALLTDRYPTALPGYPSDRRSLIALEMYTTERTFVRGLEIVIKIFLIKIESSNLLDSKEFYSVFSNVEDILALNRDLLDDIFERMSSWSDKQCIGDVFLKYENKFNIFAEYCKNYDTGEEIIRQKKKKNNFEALLQECYSNPKCMPGQTISSYLITVIQRFPRYIMLLKDLIKRTPDSHPDSQNLKDSLKIMEEKTAFINEQLKQSQCQKALEALQTNITGLSQFESPDRTLVHEGPVCLLTGKMTYQCVLFNDLIVFAHKGEYKQSVVDIVLELKTVWIENLERLCPQTANEDAIGIYTPDRPYRMYVGSVGEKKIWLKKVKEALSDLLAKNNASSEDSEMRNALYTYKNGTEYDGSFLNTKRHGHGKMTIPNLMKYEGEWEDDERNGSGMAKFCTGEVYEGMWKDDKPDGLGTFKYSTGDEISCDWRDGLKVGPCTINFKNGDRFTGECVDGQIEGYGELICIGGLHYCGNWLKNMKHGEGTLTLHDGTEYKGIFARDKFHGGGELIYPDGSYYKGEFEHGLRCGDGIFTDIDDNSYDGKWADNKKNGRGTMTYENGDAYTGTWLNDVRQGQGKMTYGLGGYYKGVWECDLKHGTGVMELRNGHVYDGEFINDMICGSGTMKYKDGSRFVGDWKHGVANGRGILTKPGGWTCDGVWLEGKENGHCTLKDPQNEYEYDGDWLSGIKEGEGTEIRQGFTFSGAFLEDLYHGPGVEESPEKSRYEGNWHRGMKHGKGILRHASKTIENQTWKHGYLIESPLIHIPRERTPIQRWIYT